MGLTLELYIIFRKRAARVSSPSSFLMTLVNAIVVPEGTAGLECWLQMGQRQGGLPPETQMQVPVQTVIIVEL